MERLGMTVIGSGPAAVACTYALVKRGYHVTLLDAATELEPERQQVVQRLMPLEYEAWDDAALAVLREGAGATASGVPLKRMYGSDFPYRGASDHLALTREHVAGFASLAKGGLSNVWGAAVLPFRPSDLGDWPVAVRRALSSAYAAVFEFLPLAATEDDLASMFPLYAKRLQSLDASPQAEELLERMSRHREKLRQRGITFGRSRLAVQADDGLQHPGCNYCAMCMYGCPRDLIYRSVQTLDALTRTGRVTYIPDVIVDQVREDGDTVYIHAHDRMGRGTGVIAAERLFVASGTLSTARLMLQSLQAEGVELTMKDSQYFLLPVAALSGQSGIARARLHTLAQIFIEIEDQRLSKYPIHLQLYTYNDLYANAVRSVAGPAYPLARAPANILLNRLMVIQGYLHSNASSTASITLTGGRLILRRNENLVAKHDIKAIAKTLRREHRSLGIVPITPMLKVGDPGQGAHIGGTFPMKDEPGPFESDIWGRPHGAQRIHLVDGSVLPSIPATTITLSIMANAYRIGWEAMRYA